MTQHADAEYEAALAAEDAGERLKLLARDITRTVGRYAIACTYTADTSSGLHFGRLQPNSAALVRLFLSTGQFDVALARVDCQPGSLVVTALKMHPRPATPKVIRQRVRYSSFARWSGDVRRGAVVILVWPKMLRLRFLGFEEGSFVVSLRHRSCPIS
ncbi:hypothetical protein SDRG_17081 [Saprolegnia diclina VS20]|uniref:Uncharacterized protein n=1 Tax=Saprolegnia diclina (strain VS20) TaxID=1156394 RepID=T0PI49_SAPDV|nr:hypothetical protein SDRG_17081 [Saprolegnia diclina VS20]EQC25034.1 hypothetical protein SDRG_17081 [Saprolegnia diclina VS20]|eukprot:XP_008621538.1 hypothetical protein SDRG_17081 [Saprolegnia diclina VS20]